MGAILFNTSLVSYENGLHNDEYQQFTIDDIDRVTLAASASTSWISLSSPAITQVGLSYTIFNVNFTIQYNDTPNDRVGTITITGTDSNTSEKVTAILTIEQRMQTIFYRLFPIWKTAKYSQTNLTANKDYIDYALTFSDGVFSGRSYTIENKNEFQLNDIMSNHVYDTFDFPDSYTANGTFIPNSNSMKNFNLYIHKNGLTSLAEQFNVINDWSYVNYDDEGNSLIYLSNPISCVLDSRQLFLFSYICSTTSGASTNVNIYLNDMFVNSANTQGHYTFIQNLDETTYPGDFEVASFNNDFLLYQYGSFNDKAKMILNFNNVYRFNIINSCKQYCLYYLNARGGWDTLLVDGKTIRTDNYTNNSYKKNFDNDKKSNWGLINFSKNIQVTWKLSTGYLSDSQSEKMQNLLGSTKAYLHDLNSGEIYSVVINNKNCEYKTFLNQGRKMFTHTIEVEASQNLIRGK